MCHFDSAWKTVGTDLQHRHQIKPEQSQIIEVIGGQIFTTEMGMDEPQSSQTSGSPTETTNLRDYQMFSITYDDVADVPVSAHQDTDLASQFV